MGINNVITVVSVFLAGLVPASCHKETAQQKNSTVAQIATAAGTADKAAATNTTSSVLHDLGEVALTNHYETCVRLGGGKQCTLSPKVIDRGNIEITFALESKTSAGKIHDLSVAQIVTRSGKPMEIAVGDFNLTLTPKMATE